MNKKEIAYLMYDKTIISHRWGRWHLIYIVLQKLQTIKEKTVVRLITLTKLWYS